MTLDRNSELICFSTFSGIGGFEKAIQDVSPKWKVIGYSEIDKYAIKIYEKHFPNTKNYGDIDLIDIPNLPDFDFLFGGSPCTDLSISKKNRMGLEGEKSKLFFKFVEILKVKKPKYFLLENVASMPKESKNIISELLGVEPVMINASLVSAQQRKRLFWCNWKVEQPEDREIYLKNILEYGITDKDKSYCIDSNYYKGSSLKHYEEKGNRQLIFVEKKKSNTVRSSGRGSGINNKHNWDSIRIGQIGKGGQGDRIYSTEGKSVSLNANGGGRGAKTGLYAVSFRGRHLEDGKRKDILHSKTEQRLEVGSEEKANCLTSVFKDSMVMEDSIVRKLTPIECERLQCFSDNWTEGISNSQRYKCIGNAVNVEVVKHILTEMLKNKPPTFHLKESSLF
jgi:DNA (cytosine-5)-methyltransferase 3A